MYPNQNSESALIAERLVRALEEHLGPRRASRLAADHESELLSALRAGFRERARAPEMERRKEVGKWWGKQNRSRRGAMRHTQNEEKLPGQEEKWANFEDAARSAIPPDENGRWIVVDPVTLTFCFPPKLPRGPRVRPDARVPYKQALASVARELRGVGSKALVKRASLVVLYATGHIKEGVLKRLAPEPMYHPKDTYHKVVR